MAFSSTDLLYALYAQYPYALPVPTPLPNFVCAARTTSATEPQALPYEVTPSTTTSGSQYVVADEMSPDGEPKSFGHLMKGPWETWYTIPEEMRCHIANCLESIILEEMDADEQHAKEHYKSVIATRRLEWRKLSAQGEGNDLNHPQLAYNVPCSCMSDHDFLYHQIPASFTTIKKILDLSLLIKEIRERFLPILLKKGIKVFCVPELTESHVTRGNEKIHQLFQFFQRLDYRTLGFVTKLEVVTLGSFGLVESGESNFKELERFYELYPFRKFTSTNLPIPRARVDEL
ncbi:hypothetical protein EJ08DRAFT_647984 [Tothia fuscella]|uniref:Uncharacterized protein n=1 Tax=Tothia fuscella TaxID=1048955 RepID=A0A9P4NW82_9PEZI|nr:hypothetical protein EJ08DRAFT_647984 [Tothia fuscella]